MRTANKSIFSRASDKEHSFISIRPISSPNPTLDHLLESSHSDDSNKWSNIGFSEEAMQVMSIEVNLMHIIRSTDVLYCRNANSILQCTQKHYFISVLRMQERSTQIKLK